MRLASSSFIGLATVAALGLFAGAPQADAQGQALASEGGAITLEGIVITAARAERPLEDIPAAVTVIDRAEIDEQLAVSSSPAAAIAKLVPGYSTPNQTISSASETFRGRDVLVMLDGVPLNTPLRDVSRVLNLVDLNAVERIEVVAGASSLYGSNATGGTVNFITKQPTAGEATVTASSHLRAFTADVGNSLQPELSGSITGAAESGVDYVAVATGRMADRTYDGSGRELPSDGMLGQGGGDRFESLNLLAKLGYDIDASKRFEVTGTWVYLDQEPDWLTDYGQSFARPDFSSPYPGESVLEDTKSFSARYTDSAFALGDLSVVGFYNDVHKRFNYSEFDAVANPVVYYSGDPTNPTSPDNQTELYSERGGVNLTVDTPLDTVHRGMKLTWGADVIHEEASQKMTSGEDVITPLSQMTYAAFGQLQVPLGDRLTLRGGMRHEYFDLTVDDFVRPTGYTSDGATYQALAPDLDVTGGEFDYEATTFNLGATVKLMPQTELFGGFSQGFSLPDVGSFTRRAGANGLTDLTQYGCLINPPGGGLGIPGCAGYAPPPISYANIAPEAQIVNNYELGLRGSHGDFTGSVTSFVSTSDKGVNFDAATNQIEQQKEIIYGVEAKADYYLTPTLKTGGVFTFREGRYDTDKDGDYDAWLPNNRIATPFRASGYLSNQFDSGLFLRGEVEWFSGRDHDDTGVAREYDIEGAWTANLLAKYPLAGGTLSLGAQNIFDVTYENPSATATRNIPVNAYGRTVSVGYSTRF